MFEIITIDFQQVKKLSLMPACNKCFIYTNYEIDEKTRGGWKKVEYTNSLKKDEMYIVLVWIKWQCNLRVIILSNIMFRHAKAETADYSLEEKCVTFAFTSLRKCYISSAVKQHRIIDLQQRTSWKINKNVSYVN